MRRDLKGKRVILTGATGGMGQATARGLAKAGARLIIAARTADALRNLQKELAATTGAEVIAVPTDVTNPADRRKLIDTAIREFGGLDVLINLSGIGSHGHFISSTPEINRDVMETNFFAPVELMRLAVPHLTEGNQPAILNVSSMTGRRAMPAWPEYSASKWALVGISEALRGELTRFGIDVLQVLPGLTNSGFDKKLLRKDGRMVIRFDKGMTPEYVGNAIVTALEKNKRETVLGREAKLMLLMNKLFPRLTRTLVARAVRKQYAKPDPNAAGKPN
jgi:short-subunit dehydrogenase